MDSLKFHVQSVQAAAAVNHKLRERELQRRRSERDREELGKLSGKGQRRKEKRVCAVERQLKVIQIRVGNDKLIKLYFSPALRFVIVADYVYVIFNMNATWLPICRECKLGLIS